MVDWPEPRTLGVVLYPHFDLLDVCGPLHVFGMLKNVFEPVMLGSATGHVASAQGAELVAEASFEEAEPCALLLVPGGGGARALVKDDGFVAWLTERAGSAEMMLSVSTGSVLLARAGLLDGKRAATSARAMAWAGETAPNTRWTSGERWVDEGSVVTAAGVSAGLDMALHVIDRLCAPDVSANVARSLEYPWP